MTDDLRDELVPDRIVIKEFSITRMTLFRWDKRPDFGFPPPVYIGDRKYRSRKQLEAFKAHLVAQAIAARAQTAAG